MAHRRRHRRMHGIEVIPGLGDMMSVFKAPVRGTDVLIGALASLAGIWGVKKILNMPMFVGKVPAGLLNFVPAISGAVAGTAAYMLLKRTKMAHKAAGIAVGAVGAGVAINAMNFLKVKFPELADLVDLRLSGIILNDPAVQAMRGYNGLLMDDSGRLGATDFAALGAVGGAEAYEDLTPG